MVGFFAYRLGNKVIDLLTAENKPKINYAFLKNNFFISFEQDREKDIFSTNQSAYEISEKFATDGIKSIRIEMPSGREFSGIYIDVYDKDCFNWENMSEFSFDVLNDNIFSVNLKVKIRSGKQYPKKEYETSQNIPPNTKAKFKIKRVELEGVLDLGNISNLNFFVQDPITTVFLNIDNIKIVKR